MQGHLRLDQSADTVLRTASLFNLAVQRGAEVQHGDEGSRNPPSQGTKPAYQHDGSQGAAEPGRLRGYFN